MTEMRPGTKIRFWTPGYRNRPDVQPPGLLRLVGGLSFLSVVGMLVYITALALTGTTGSYLGRESAIYIALVHFLLPLSIGYTVGVNSPASRILIVAYCGTLYAATLADKGYLGLLKIDAQIRFALATAALVLVLSWLYGSPKMRLYYLMLRNAPIPDSLAPHEATLAAKPWINPRLRATLDWLADNLEIIVILGFIIVAFYAYWRIS